MKEFYQSVVASEEECARFLRERGLLIDEVAVEDCHRCGSPMNEVTRRNQHGECRQSFKCTNWRCATYRSARTGTGFFRLNDRSKRGPSKLKLVEILEIVFLWALDMSATKIKKGAGYSRETIDVYFNRLRETCSRKCSERPKMIGTAKEPVQIDEAYMSGRRKYNRGRTLDGDKRAEEVEPEARGRRRNGGDRISGSWVLGLYKKGDVRYYAVPDRKASTLLSIIKREVAAGSVIHTDEWPAYSKLRQQGYRHFTVNHQKNFVDPHTGAHTQGIERQWLELKTKIMGQMRGASQANLQQHLDEASYRHMPTSVCPSSSRYWPICATRKLGKRR